MSTHTDTERRSGTLRMVVCLVPDGGPSTVSRDDPVFLSWDGTPHEAHRYAGEWGIESCEFGDYDCDPLPSMPPAEPGLWLLTWAWREVPHPEGEEYDDGATTTVKYAETCEWRRPTLAELAELGVLPTGTPAGAGEGA